MYLLVKFTISTKFNSIIWIDTQHVNAAVSKPNETQTIADTNIELYLAYSPS